MTTRRWTLKLLIELGAVLVAVMVLLAAPAAPASATPAQDPVVEVDPVLEADPTGVADPEPVVEVEPAVEAQPESRSLLTESRKIVAIIGGLVFVALALLLLTIRYWRVTKPIPAAAAPERSAATSAATAGPTREVVSEEAVVAPITSEVPVSVAIAAQPAATRPKPAIARPGRDARQAALARPANGSSGR